MCDRGDTYMCDRGDTDTYICDRGDTYMCDRGDTYMCDRGDTYMCHRGDTYMCDRGDTAMCNRGTKVSAIQHAQPPPIKKTHIHTHLLLAASFTHKKGAYFGAFFSQPWLEFGDIGHYCCFVPFCRGLAQGVGFRL
jgi:hypothetical protein